MPNRARSYSTIGIYGLAAVLLLLASLGTELGPRAAVLYPACIPWDEKAADTIARLVHEPNDVSLRQAGDALFRLRRARRNCRAGWLALSCQDYYAVVRLRGDASGRETPMSKAPCALVMLE